MNDRDILSRARSLRVLVIGEAMLDCYLRGSVERLCREAPVPVLSEVKEDAAPGGAANAAALCAGLGATVRFLSVCGDDAAGHRLGRLLDGLGVDRTAMSMPPGRETLVKKRIVGNGQLLARVDSGSEDAADALTERRLIATLEEAWRTSDAVIVSDYDYGVLTPAVVEAVVRLQTAGPRVLAVDARDLARWRDARATVVKPNYDEALALLGQAPVAVDRRFAQMRAAADRLLDLTGANIVAATLDVSGAMVASRNHPPHRTATDPAPADHAAGAGDGFTVGFAVALAGGAGMSDAADFAAHVAAICVHDAGTTLCAPNRLVPGGKHVPADRLPDRIADYRRAGARVVFTNGCFDILHSGHVDYLKRARALGDVLVVGLNSDASVRALKGPSRPVNAHADRAAVLAALESVDLLVTFDEPTPAALIEAIAPDVFAKGGDYTRATLPEADLVERLGGEVRIIDLVPDRSTTGLIARIAAAPETLAS